MRHCIFILMILISTWAIGQNEVTNNLVDQIETLTASIENNPDNPDIYVDRAKAIFKLNSIKPDQSLVKFNLEDALKDAETAISLDNNDPYVYSVMAELQRDINTDYGKAIEYMDKALELDPDNPNLYLQRANYQKVSSGCDDYRKCAMYNDERCEKIVKEFCMHNL